MDLTAFIPDKLRPLSDGDEPQTLSDVVSLRNDHPESRQRGREVEQERRPAQDFEPLPLEVDEPLVRTRGPRVEDLGLHEDKHEQEDRDQQSISGEDQSHQHLHREPLVDLNGRKPEDRQHQRLQRRVQRLEGQAVGLKLEQNSGVEQKCDENKPECELNRCDHDDLPGDQTEHDDGEGDQVSEDSSSF